MKNELPKFVHYNISRIKHCTEKYTVIIETFIVYFNNCGWTLFSLDNQYF